MMQERRVAQVNFMMTASERLLLERLCIIEGDTLSSVLRRLVRSEMAKHEKPVSPGEGETDN